MRRLVIFLAVLCMLPGGSPRATDIAAGLTEALMVGTDRVVKQLGKPGGFLDDPKVRIPVPGPLKQVQSALRLAGIEPAMRFRDFVRRHPVYAGAAGHEAPAGLRRCRKGLPLKF